MATAIPNEVDPDGFEARLRGCSPPLLETVAYLRSTAEHAGSEVAGRRFRHAKPNSGWGVTYYTGVTPFCEIHPKRSEGHVWVLLHGADTEALLNDGFEASEQMDWFKIRRMEEAVRMVRWVLQSHDACASSVGRV